MERDSFVFYKSYYEAVKNLDDKTQLSIFESICEYALYHNEIELDKTALSLFTLIKPNLEANYKKWVNGCKGGAPKGTINNPKGKNQFNKKDNQEDNQRKTKGKSKDNAMNNELCLMNNVDVLCTNDNEIHKLHTDGVAFIELPLNELGKYKQIYQEEIDYYKNLFPNVNVEQELRNMLGWLNSNPKKRKTKNGINQFINSWLSRKQDNSNNYDISNNSYNKKFTIADMQNMKGKILND